MPTTTTTYVKITQEAFQLLMEKIECLSHRICILEQQSPDSTITIDDAYIDTVTSDWCTACTDPTPTPTSEEEV